MSDVVNRARTPQERLYGILMLIAGILIWPLVAWGFWAGTHSPDPRISSVTNLYLFYAVALALFVILASGAYRARAFGHMILLGPDQFPKLHGMVVEGAKALGMSNTPKTFIYNSNGLLNAFARRLFGGQYVFLTSALVDASDDEQVRFVIGHELGHHAAGHLNPWMNFLKLPGYVVPFLQPAHSRGREYTCDKLGLHVAKDVAVSQGALMMLGCGCRRLNPDMNRDAFMAQEAMVPPIFGFLTEIMQSHPRITRRLRAMRDAGGR